MVSILRILATVVGVFVMSLPVFAQGEAEVCLGNVSGVVDSGDVNVGRISFDAHAPFVQGRDTDLGILGLGRGYAPGSKGNAACTSREAGRYNGVDFDHRVKGYAWSENLGFISFSCEDGRNVSGEVGGGTACGGFDYGVYLGLPVNGVREAFGYAWNPVFGYMQFRTANFPEFGVKVDANGRMSGYVWTEAGVWLDMTGVVAQVFNSDEEYLYTDEEGDLEEGGDDWCADKPFLCVDVDPFVPQNDVIKSGRVDGGDGGEFDIGIGEEVRVADGRDGYDVNLYLRDGNGGNLDPAVYNVDEFTDSIEFIWEDTVSRGQFGSKVNDYAEWTSPWNQSSGGVVFKPRGFGDLKEFASGHFVGRNRVTSYAPTSSANVSFSRSEPPYPFRNELFLNLVSDVAATIAPNRLVLKRIEYGALTDVNGVEVLSPGAIFPNGRVEGVEFHFRPALSVDTLYANNNEDEISAYRGVPVNFRLSGEILGDLPKAALTSASVTFGLDYSKQQTIDEFGCDPNGFEFAFLGEVNGNSIEGQKKSSFLFTRDLSAPLDIQAVASLPELEEGEEVELPCDYAVAPSFYTYIGYLVGDKAVNYYSNKLPKTAAGIVNPSIVVHGNIYGQKIGNVAANNSVQLQGSLDTNVVRDKLNANLEKYAVDDMDEPAKQGRCIVTALNRAEAKGYAIGGTNCGKTYRAFVVGEENVLYVKGQDVVLDLKTAATQNQWVVVVDGGNIFINNSVDNDDDSERRVTLVALRDSDDAKYFKTGNGYLAGGKAMVVDATMIFDGSLFAHSGDLAQVLSEKGEPVWESEAARRQILGYQALIRGSIYSDNTIGGADLDGGRNPKDYLLIGGGEILETPVSGEDRMRAQAYDLNYLRMFTLEIERCDNGYPKDQVCGRCLSPEDIVAIATNAEELCGEKGVCNQGRRGNFVCNGINAELQYDGGAQASGDLVPPRDRTKLVSDEALNSEEDFDPVYVFFRAPNRSSFIFK
ncbi:hypothetical protein KA119_02510 [Candidatus Gracilibacteria bacterium]|nr:hypothetical protein [Candidatus Gracilibacteria bacterium]